MIAALYSDRVVAENAPMDLRLAASIKARGERIGYVSSGPDPERSYFDEKRDYYRHYGLGLDVFIDLDEAGAGDIAKLFACDAIHLSGGDTGSFLQRLRKSGVFPTLRKWALDGGILVGTSAGAILMTPGIAVDAMFSGGLPEEMKEATGLDLLPFEFFPHLNWDDRYLPELLRYSAITAHPIITCRDGEGIIVEDGRLEAFGAPLLIFRGSIDGVRDGPLADVLPHG